MFKDILTKSGIFYNVNLAAIVESEAKFNFLMELFNFFYFNLRVQ